MHFSVTEVGRNLGDVIYDQLSFKFNFTLTFHIFITGCFKLVRNWSHNWRRSWLRWRRDACSSHLRRIRFASQRHARRCRRSWRHASFTPPVTQRRRQFLYVSWIWDCQDYQGEGLLPGCQPSKGRDSRIRQAGLSFTRFEKLHKMNFPKAYNTLCIFSMDIQVLR